MHPLKTNDVRQYFPTERLKPYVRYFVISERVPEGEYKVLPSPGAVIGLQYRGRLSVLKNHTEIKLNSAEITGISDSYRIFRSSADIGTVLIYFTETGLAHFASSPANELFNLSLSLEDIFAPECIRKIKENLHFATSDEQRIRIAEQFLLARLNDKPPDKLNSGAAALILKANGVIRIKNLAKALYISQSPFEKRFKRIVGMSPKKFASIVRFNYIIGHLKDKKSLVELSYENGFYDQAHFSKEFRRYTGETPEHLKAGLMKAPFFATAESSDSAPSQPDLRVKAIETLHLR